MFKMGLHYSFGHLKHKLWPKEGPRVKLLIWFPTRKSRESTWFTYLQTACNIPLESSQRGLQRCFRPHLDLRFALKVAGVPTWAISKLPLRSPGTKNHLDVGPVERCRIYYIKERWWFPPSSCRGESCVSVLPVARPSTKNAPTTH
jgi:hypothetical protein